MRREYIVGSMVLLALLAAAVLIWNHSIRRSHEHVTTAPFQSRGALASAIPEAYQISEPKHAANLPYPVHRGAERYYRRSEPGFLVVYAS